MQKKAYTGAEIEVLFFDTDNVVAASGDDYYVEPCSNVTEIL